MSGPPAGTVPELIRPMLATTAPIPEQPAGSIPGREQWAYEMKWDGVRAIVYLGPHTVRVMSRNDRDVSVSYPELQGMADHLASPGSVLDGEIVSFDSSGRPSFGRLQQRMHVTDPGAAQQLSQTVPAVFLAFDLLRLGDRSLLDHTYADRRELLERLDIDTAHWQTPPAFSGSGRDAVQASLDQHLEGVVAKRVDSVYRPGVRTMDWRKAKNIKAQEVVVLAVRHRVDDRREVVIGGWRPGNGRRSDTIGSLLMGVPEPAVAGRPAGLLYVGHVGTGFSEAVLAQLSSRLTALRTDRSPFSTPLPRADARDAIWVRPSIVGEVAYSEWTTDDRLRHPAWRGLRPDKRPEDVVREA